MRIEVRKSDAFDADRVLWLIRDGKYMELDASGDCDDRFYTGRMECERKSIDHARAFAILRAYGHDPVYVDEPVAATDPHAEWRDAVTEFCRHWAPYENGGGRVAVAVHALRVVEAAERAKKEVGLSVTRDGKGGAK